ncbi:MAG TPA: hypothetical protein VIF82_17165 [Burkholderiaceae bacterium]|jgi:hypothetical protein
MTPKHMLMAAALVVAAWLALFGDKTPNSGIAEPVAHTAGASAHASVPVTSLTVTSHAEEKTKTDTAILTLKNRDQLMGGARADSRPDALFKSQSWTPPPAPPMPPPPPPPPVAPPLPFKYIGKKVEDGKWEVYVAIGAQAYIVHEKTVLQGTYRVDSIKPPVLSLTYLPLQQLQTLTIGGID